MWIALALFGCGSQVTTPPSNPCGTGSCPAGQTCVDERCVDDDPCADVTCDAGEVCVDGTCHSAEEDADGDGFPVGADCDDTDAKVVPGSMRTCSTECGAGDSVCSDGAWTECTAPVPPCDCEVGEVNQEPCGFCGTQARECVDGAWAPEPGKCESPGECAPGVDEVSPCGECGTAVRPCGEDCTLGDGSACVGPEAPEPSAACPPERPLCDASGACVSEN